MRRPTFFPLLAPVLLAACHGADADPRVLPPLVAVTTVEPGTEGATRYTGVVQARVESDLGFRVGGKVVDRLVTAGQAVRRGQALMRLDPADLALVGAARAADVAALRARAVQADSELKRLQGLVQLGAISAQSYDQSKTAADAARAQLAAGLAQARVAVNSQGYAVLVADADGVVETTSAEPGQVVAAGQTVVKLAHAGPREAVVTLPETVRPALGAPATAGLYGGTGATYPARLRQLSQVADPATRTYEARYVLEGAGGAAPLGSTVTLTLAGAGGPASASVPLGAIYDPGSGPGVWSLAADRVRFTPVRIRSLAPEAAVIEGVEAGRRIVALGADRLRENQVVRVAALPGTRAAVAAR